jgi:sulfonate transport system permease protein
MEHYTAQRIAEELGDVAPSPARMPPGLWLPLALLVLLEVAVRTGLVASHLLPAPSQVVAALASLGVHGLAAHVGASVARVLAGFLSGAGSAIAVALVTGLWVRAEQALDPTLQALRAIPSLAWVPLLLLWLGIDEAPKITLIAIGAFFPVYLNLHSGIRDVDRRLVEAGRAFGLRGWQLARRLLLPAALPALFTALRQGLGMAWMFVVAAELIAASRGVGFLLTEGRELGRADLVLGAILLLGCLGKLGDGVLRLLEARVLHWRDAWQPGAPP